MASQFDLFFDEAKAYLHDRYNHDKFINRIAEFEEGVQQLRTDLDAFDLHLDTANRLAIEDLQVRVESKFSTQQDLLTRPQLQIQCHLLSRMMQKWTFGKVTGLFRKLEYAGAMQVFGTRFIEIGECKQFQDFYKAQEQQVLESTKAVHDAVEDHKLLIRLLKRRLDFILSYLKNVVKLVEEVNAVNSASAETAKERLLREQITYIVHLISLKELSV